MKLHLPANNDGPKIEDLATTTIRMMLGTILHDKEGTQYDGLHMETSFLIPLHPLRADQVIQLLAAVVFNTMAELQAQTRLPGYSRRALEHDIHAIVDRNLMEGNKWLGRYPGDTPEDKISGIVADGPITNQGVPQEE